MATTTLYRFQIELSDVPRAVYETLDFRLAQHPSEALPYLLTRVLAYCLSFEDGLNFSSEGLADPDAPALSQPDPYGGTRLWIEIGNPSARKLHKASKASKDVRVYTYKNPELLIKEAQTEGVHRAAQIQLFSFSSDFLSSLAGMLERDNRWSLLHDDGVVTIHSGTRSAQGEIRAHSFV
jgi:uncharacterized protein YaeQ